MHNKKDVANYFLARLQLQLHKYLLQEIIFASASVSHGNQGINYNYIKNSLEKYCRCQVTITITWIIPMQMIYVIISWTMVHLHLHLHS